MKGASAGLKVGLTAILIALLGWFAFKFVGKGIKGEEGYQVWALFHDATGLVDKSRVQVAGLTIGEISKRSLAGQYARVEIKIKPDTVLWSNATIYKRTASLLGEFYLEIDPGGEFSLDPLTDKQVPNYKLDGCYEVTHKENCNQITNVVEAVTTSDVLAQISETLPVLREILKDVQKLVEGPMQNIADDVQRGITRNSEAAERLLNHIDQIATDVKGITGGETNRDLRESMRNIRQITESVKSLVGAGEGQVNSTADKIKTELDKISVTLDKFNQSLDNVAQVTGDVAQGKGTVGRLLKDETIADNITDITQDTSDFIRTITRLQTIVGVREEYHTYFSDLSSLGTFKTYLTLRLQPRPDKYYLIELVDDPRGSKTYSHTLTATSSTPGQAPTVTNTDTYTRTPAFRFSFQFAKRVQLWNAVGLTGRIGIKESTGGLGGDLDLWGERFVLSLDVFDFLAEKYPRLKVLLALEFIRHFWVVAGLDDLLNGPGNDRVQGLTCGPATPTSWCQDGRTFFVGLQLTFNDKDLAALLTVGGGAISGAAK